MREADLDWKIHSFERAGAIRFGTTVPKVETILGVRQGQERF
jgi:hypothetical protein